MSTVHSVFFSVCGCLDVYGVLRGQAHYISSGLALIHRILTSEAVNFTSCALFSSTACAHFAAGILHKMSGVTLISSISLRTGSLGWMTVVYRGSGEGIREYGW